MLAIYQQPPDVWQARLAKHGCLALAAHALAVAGLKARGEPEVPTQSELFGAALMYHARAELTGTLPTRASLVDDCVSAGLHIAGR